MHLNAWQSSRLMGFGALNAANPVLADIGFAEGWSLEDWGGVSGWVNHINHWKLGTYEPLTDAVRNRAEGVWAGLKTAIDAGSIAAENLRESLKNELSLACDAVDRDTKQYAGWARPDSAHKNRIRLLTAVNTIMKKIANTVVPVPPQPQTPVYTEPASPPAAVIQAPPTITVDQAGMRQAGNPIVQTPSGPMTQQQYLQLQAGEEPPMKVLGIPITVLIPVALAGSLAALIVVKRLRRRRSLAGYRRRSRRTRR